MTQAITGRGVDHVVETTGDAAFTDLALDLLNHGGRLALLTGGRGPADLPGGRKVLSVIQGDAVPQRFIPYLIGLYQKGQFPFDRLVTFYARSIWPSPMPDPAIPSSPCCASAIPTSKTGSDAQAYTCRQSAGSASPEPLPPWL